MKIVPYDNLRNSDLIVDAVYAGGGSVGELGDPISKVLPGCGNLGGFRAAGRGEIKKFVVLYTSGEDKDWPDTLDLNTGRFTYYGDNKTPGHELHDTPKKGNLILRNVFDWLHADPPRRENVPPFFVFVKYPTKNSSRSVQFKGLAVPGFPGLTATEDLIAVWKTSDSQRFQNYRSTFTVLDVATVEREWIRDLKAGKADTEKAPPAWRTWKQQGMYTPLTSEPTTIIRSVESQSPDNELQESILETVFEYFKDTPTNFEAFAAKVFQLFDQRVIIDEITRGTVDGGRDAVGRYLLGIPDDPVYAEFALEAKCYRPPLRGKKVNTVGVKEVSRLIARLRHRQFGILVTTSVVAKQAYEEVRTDRHPVVFICGKDITEILVSKGFNTPEVVRRMLENEFPK
jgi:hypothetical protein